MKLFIQIPCLNEEEVLLTALKDLPKEIPGVDSIEILVIDDGSTDRTVEVARDYGVGHVLSFNRNKGLATAFKEGIAYCVDHGADIIVNTDADNQYYGPDIERLVVHLIEGEFDIVIGDRQTDTIAHFSPLKKRLQKFGSFVVRKLSGTMVPDATSGFRAYSRQAAMQMNIISTFSYTLETIIQAGKKNLKLGDVPIRTNKEVLRPSRLFKSIPDFIKNSASTMLRIYATYEPLKTFLFISATLFILGLFPFVRFLIFAVQGQGQGHIQSLIVGGVILTLSFMVFFLAIIADLVAANRKLIEDMLFRMKQRDQDVLGEKRKTGKDE